MRIIYKNKKVQRRTIYAKEIPIGQVFHGNIRGWIQLDLLLRFDKGIISLDNPSNVWMSNLDSLCVENYLPAETELIVYE